jgi:hypothetical protein
VREERPRSAKDLGPDLLEVTLTEKTRGRSVFENRIKALEPGLDNGRLLRLDESASNDEGLAKAPLSLAIRLP